MHSRSSPPDTFSTPLPAANVQAAAAEDLVKSMVKEGRHVVLWSSDRHLLWDCALSLQTCWLELLPHGGVAHFSGGQRLALLSHINQNIALVGVQPAMQTPSESSALMEICIVDHAELLSTSDLQLLLGLAQHLPGLGLRWVLLCHDLPGQSCAATAMLNTPPVPKNWLGWHLTPETSPAAHAPPQPEPHRPSKPRQGNAWVWLGVMGFLGLVAWFAWDQSGRPDATDFARLVQQKAPTNTPTQAPAMTPPVSPSALPTVTPPPSPTETPLTAPTLDTPVQAAAATAPTNEAAPSTSPVDSVKNEPSKAGPPAPEDRLKLPEIAVRGARWLAQQTPEFFVLEHGTFDTAAQAQSLIRSRQELSNARVIMVKPGQNNAGKFRVITGPFRSAERAQNFKIRENLPPQVAVRTVSSVLNETATSP